MRKYLNPDQDSGKLFYQEFLHKGKVVMLNLLKFRPNADYENVEVEAPVEGISGLDAYREYMKLTSPFIEEIGSKVLFYGSAKHFLIGPLEEKWDAVLLVEHPSVEKFMEFASNKEYLKVTGHRTAALEDSRLLPITEIPLKE